MEGDMVWLCPHRIILIRVAIITCHGRDLAEMVDHEAVSPPLFSCWPSEVLTEIRGFYIWHLPACLFLFLCSRRRCLPAMIVSFLYEASPAMGTGRFSEASLLLWSTSLVFLHSSKGTS